MTEVEHLRRSPDVDAGAWPVDSWAGQWWPWIALLLGVAVVVIGGILFAP